MKKRITAAFLIIGIGGILVIIGMMMGGSVKKAFYKSICAPLNLALLPLNLT